MSPSRLDRITVDPHANTVKLQFTDARLRTTAYVEVEEPAALDTAATLTRNGYYPTLFDWAIGRLADAFDQRASDDPEWAETWNDRTPQERQDYLRERAKALAEMLGAAYELFINEEN